MAIRQGSVSDGVGAACLLSSSDPTACVEFLPLQGLFDSSAQPPDCPSHIPLIATKNNLLKLNWLHSSAQPVDIMPTYNNNTAGNSSRNTPPKPSSTKHRTVENIRKIQTIPNGEGTIYSTPLDLQDSQLLVQEPKTCIGILNAGEEDEMKVTGYRRSHLRTAICWLCICLTGGLLRLVLYWWRHWYLLATSRSCTLQEAEVLLIEDDYQGKHKTYHVKPILNLSVERAKQLIEEPSSYLYTENVNIQKLQLSVHFSSAQFKYTATLRTFRCKQLIYVWDNNLNKFTKITGLDLNVPCSYFYQQHGLTSLERLSRQIVYGPNEITVPYKDMKTLIFLEMLNPFYVFQIFSVILWFTYDYYYYACVILMMSIFGIIMSTLQTKKNQDTLRQTVLNTGMARVLDVNGHALDLATRLLVPGDIIIIPSYGCTMHCDAILLSGNCIVDESMLTGESVPITKTPLPPKRDFYDKKEHSRHTLFCGTKVIQTRYIGSKQVLAFVINTGNITAKGGLIRSVLYPPPVDFKFEQDSYKFIQCLALIACIGFLYTLVTKIIRGVDAVKIAVESLDLITIVVPPALPAAMTVGRFYAQKRLKLNNIFCISPRAINVAGSIDCCCFDKTGTLTEDGLDLWGVVPKSSTNEFQIPLKDVQRLPNDHFLFSMVTCHSITVLNGQLMGDPLDLKMFESTGWVFEDCKTVPENENFELIYPTILRQPSNDQQPPPVIAPPLAERQSSIDDLLANIGVTRSEQNFDHGIVREFPFSSQLQRMAVITSCLSSPGFTVYCKGAPEMLQQLCRPGSMPANYVQQLSIYAKKGYRIIALAYKSLSPKINYTKALRLTREDIEIDLEFLGFVIMENRLKSDTTEVIRKLRNAHIRTIMVTGDNILTAMSVARDCGIVGATQTMITVHVASTTPYELQYTLEPGSKITAVVSNGNGLTSSIATSCASSLSKLPNSNSLTSIKTCETWTHNDINDVEDGRCSNVAEESAFEAGQYYYSFAMDGKTWQVVRDHFPEQMKILLTRGVVFARMSPDQKQSLIMELQQLDYFVAMCGDGANDCGALKVAHTGISLSETETSIASPFTSIKPTIAAVPSVIKEGRAALVTSFGIFKYMAAYSLVQFVSVMILYSIDSNLTDKQYLYVDLGLISLFALFFGKTEAYSGQLAKNPPLTSLISPTPLASLLLHLVVVVMFQVAGWIYLQQQPWYKPFQHSSDEHLGCVENYTMFAISSFQYIILAFVFSKGAPYRRPIWSNWPLCLALVVNLCIVIYLVLYPNDWIAEFFQLIVPDVMSFRYLMLAFGVLSFITHVILESFVVEHLIFNKFQLAREQQTSSQSKLMHRRIEHSVQSFNNWPPITEVYEPHSFPTEEQHPTYVNLSVQQHIELPKHSAFAGFNEGQPSVGPNKLTNTAAVALPS